MGHIVLKKSIYRWKSAFTGILDSANFDIRESNFPNGRNFLLTKELDGNNL
jgi:hypothetical protein